MAPPRPRTLPELSLVPCVGFGLAGLRLGYGGGFVDRTLAALQPRPWSVGLAYAHGFLPLLRPLPGEACLDTLLTEEGVVWERG